MAIRHAARIAASLSLLTLATPALAGELRAGAAMASITPPVEIFPLTSPSAPHERPFVGVHDDLFARALVLDDGATRIVLVALEATRVPEPAETARAVADAAGVPVGHVLIFATHTHNNPLAFLHGAPSSAQTGELARTRAQAVAATRAALAALRPARVGFVRGQGWVNASNGELAGLPGKYDPKGPVDRTLDVLRVTGVDGTPIALMVSYANHAEVMFRSITRDGGYEVSGDLPGAVSTLLEKSGQAPVVLFAPGAEGDQINLLTSAQPAQGALPAADAGAGGWALLDAQARRLAGSVQDVLAQPLADDASVTLSAVQGQAICPGQKMRKDRQSGTVSIEPQPDVAIPLALLRVGDVALAGIGGDVAAEIGMAVRAALPRRRTMVVSMMGDAVGYILPDAYYANPGHGVFGSPLKPGCAAAAITRGLKALDR